MQIILQYGVFNDPKRHTRITHLKVIYSIESRF